ncbi:hypothetical protein JCM10449v2_002851 [Rhodotorula kratochvilovae]
MDDRITIRTSDDPRVELKASRAILIAGSRVFADRLSLPQGDSMRTTRASCDVAETEENFKPFLRLLNLVNEPGDPLEELRDEEWMAVVPLSDKYDSPPVRGYARAKYWRLKEQVPRNAALLLLLATTMHHAKELKDAAFGLFSPRDTVSAPIDRLPPVWAARLRAWLKLLKAHALAEVLRHEPDFTASEDCSCDPDDVAILWYTAALDALKNDFASSPDYPFRERMRRALPAPEFCQRHRIEFDAQADALGWAYFESTPDILL